MTYAARILGLGLFFSLLFRGSPHAWRQMEKFTENHLKAVQVLGEDTLIVAGDGGIHFSTDRGKSWESPPFPERVVSFWADAQGAIWVTYTAIYTSESLLGPFQKYPESFVGLSSVAISPSGVAVVVGPGALASSRGVLLISENRGKSWTKVEGFERSLSTIAFTDENTGFIGGQSILKTSDGGKTWSMGVDWNVEALGANQVLGIAMDSNKTLHFVGHYYGAYYTSGPDLSEFAIKQLPPSYYPWNCRYIGFSGRMGVAAGNYAIHESFDSGSSWRKLDQYKLLRAGATSKASCFYVVGDNGVVLVSPNCAGTSILPMMRSAPRKAGPIPEYVDILGRSHLRIPYMALEVPGL